jgi:hypothetical protein
VPRLPRSQHVALPDNQPEIGEFADAPAAAGLPS